MSQTITQRSPNARTSFNTTPSKIRRLQHPVVGKSNDVILSSRNAKKSVLWCAVNVVGAIMAYSGLLSYSICHVTGFGQSAAFGYLDFTLVLLFSWNALTNVYLYCLPVVNKQNIYLSPLQKRLLGVSKENEHLFQSSPPPSALSSTPSSAPTRRSISTPTSQGPSYPVRRNTRTPTSSSNISPGRQPSPNRVQSSPVKNYSPGHTNTTPYGQTVHRSSSRDSFYTPNSPMNVSHRGLSFSSTPSPSVFNQSPSFSSRNISPGRINSQDDQLLSFTSLDKYIKQEEEQEARLRRGQDSPQKSSFWKYGSAAYEYIPSFGSYQLATRSKTPNVKDDDDDGVESLFKQDEMLKKLGFLRSDVSIWIENLRKWIAQSVLEPIVLEIDNINKRLAQLGNPEVKIGLSSTSTLQTLLATKGQHLPSLATIIPYLSVSTNQEYLVARLKELSTGGCLRLYKWDNGGNYKGKPWNSDLPTDAEIIIHLFCTYLDTHLPSNPRYADGKSFSGLHFIKSPAKPEERKSELCIYQSRTRKPHFKVLLEDQTCELPKGRNNLFVAIVVFLYYAKRNFHGMIERVNLGMSGINLLWVLEKL